MFHAIVSALILKVPLDLVILPARFILVADNNGATVQLDALTIGVLTLVVPNTRGENTEVLPHTVAPHTNVVPCTVGVHTLVVPHTSGDNTLVEPHTFVPDKDGDERLVVTDTALGKPI